MCVHECTYARLGRRVGGWVRKRRACITYACMPAHIQLHVRVEDKLSMVDSTCWPADMAACLLGLKRYVALCEDPSARTLGIESPIVNCSSELIWMVRA